MESLPAAAARPLHWIQPKAFDRAYELRTSGGELVATLVFDSAFGSRATGLSADGTWTFKRVGFFNPRVTIRKPGGEEDLAVFYPRFLGGGALEFGDAEIISWESTNIWGSRWAFADAVGNRLVVFSEGAERPKLSDVFKVQAEVHVEAEGYDPSEVALLVLLGWYLLILKQDDTAAAAAAATAAAAS